jgi:hypothetical protein
MPQGLRKIAAACFGNVEKASKKTPARDTAHDEIQAREDVGLKGPGNSG